MAWSKNGSNSFQQVPSQNRIWKNVWDTFEEMLHNTAQPEVMRIASLSLGTSRLLITGIIIQKGKLKFFMSKKDGLQKCVVDITVRDSLEDSITVSCWGQLQYVKFIDSLHVGDDVTIENAVVQPKPSDGSHERFKPYTSSPYYLNLYESKGKIKFSQENYDFYQNLLKFPVKGQNNYYTIFDLNNRDDLQGQYISILAVVKQVCEITKVTTKKGQELKKREVKLFDDTATDLSFTLWNEEWIYQASRWVPKDTVIHASDVKVDYFRKRLIIMATDRTIITLQPKMREAALLARFAETVDIDQMLFDENNWEVELDPISLEYIKEEMCIKDVKAIRALPGNEVYCIVWAMLTHFNIDDSSSAIVSHTCSHCHKRLGRERISCDCNQSCLTRDHVVSFYNLRVSLTDETGTLENCILSAKVTEKMIGETADKFGSLNQQTREHLKWKYLLERNKAVIQITQSKNVNEVRRVRVLSLETVETDHLFEMFINYKKRCNIMTSIV